VQRPLHITVERLRVARLFRPTIKCVEDTGAHKPDPAPYLARSAHSSVTRHGRGLRGFAARRLRGQGGRNAVRGGAQLGHARRGSGPRDLVLDSLASLSLPSCWRGSMAPAADGVNITRTANPERPGSAIGTRLAASAVVNGGHGSYRYIRGAETMSRSAMTVGEITAAPGQVARDFCTRDVEAG